MIILWREIDLIVPNYFLDNMPFDSAFKIFDGFIYDDGDGALLGNLFKKISFPRFQLIKISRKDKA